MTITMTIFIRKRLRAHIRTCISTNHPGMSTPITRTCITGMGTSTINARQAGRLLDLVAGGALVSIAAYELLNGSA
jgi:hypothetical protein